MPSEDHGDKKGPLPALTGPTQAQQDPIWSILPSYYMYTNTINKSSTITDADLLDPPNYEDSSSSLADSTSGSNSESADRLRLNTNLTAPTQTLAPNTITSGDSSDRIIADETTNYWRETLLDNMHKLRNLTDTHNEKSQAVSISIKFTKECGEPGVEPTFVDPLLYEYKQGDFINGYALIHNDLDYDIPFEMFYLVFEGNFVVLETKAHATIRTPVKIKKFLEMFDFSASWNEAHIDRLLTDFQNTFECPDLRDALDGSSLAFRERVIGAGKTYKRFFTFKIPENLLDTECRDHNLLKHTELPPTFGSVDGTRARETSTEVKDFLFPDTNLNYAIVARFIGRASKYNLASNDVKDLGIRPLMFNSKGDEFIIFKEACNSIRILQQCKKTDTSTMIMHANQISVMYSNFLGRLQEKVDIGNELLNAMQKENDVDTIKLAEKLSTSSLSDIVKYRQLYDQSVHCNMGDIKKEKRPPLVPTIAKYEMVVPFLSKKSLLKSPKAQGTIKFSFPKAEYKLTYIPPLRFRNNEAVDESSWRVKVPIEFSFLKSSIGPAADGKFPDIKHIETDLVALTLKSTEYAIPLEMDHSLLFRNVVSTDTTNNPYVDSDNFTHVVKKPLQKIANELYNLFKALGTEVFRVEKSLIDDLKSFCNIDAKYMNLKVEDAKMVNSTTQKAISIKEINSMKWEPSSSNEVCKKFDLCLNLASARMKATSGMSASPAYRFYNDFTLVPSFQSCHIARFYYIKVMIVISNGEVVRMKMPVKIGKD